MTVDDWVARIERVRAEDGFDSTDRPWWQTLSGPISRPPSLTAVPAPVKRQCSWCAAWKVLEAEFSRDPKSTGGYRLNCKACCKSARIARKQQAGLAVAS